MRIISEFRDYYDSVQSLGQDRSLVYLRSPRTEPFETQVPIIDIGPPRDFRIDQFLVGLAGAIYPVVRLVQDAPLPQRSAYCHSLADIEAFVADRQTPRKIRDDFLAATCPKRYRRMRQFQFTREAFAKHFAEWSPLTEPLRELFVSQRVPIFLITVNEFHRYFRTQKSTIVWNARLQSLDFARAVDPYSAFQAIQVFLGGLAQPEKPLPEVSNVDLLEAKGFDRRTSFRKPPAT